MIIKNVSINNLQLIKSVDSSFDKINIVTGINKDNPQDSGNGSGKSTLVLRAILFCFYGYCEEGLTLKDLIRFGEKECSVEVECSVNDEHFRIIRKIPSELQVFLNDKEVIANTASIKQQFINEQLGDINFFRQYRCVDTKNGINVLDLGIVSLRKTMMSFIENIFTDIRTRLLSQKAERERYSGDKKLYKHYLSDKRKTVLEIALTSAKNEINQLEVQKKEIYNTLSTINGDIQYRNRTITQKENDIEKYKLGKCPILSTNCTLLGDRCAEVKRNVDNEVDKLRQEINDLTASTAADKEYMNNLEEQIIVLENKIEKINYYLLRLKSAMQFKDYKYTKADIVIFDEAIKVMDTFSGIYIKEWLSSLSVIINNLLRAINISVEFTADKDFLKVYDNEQLLKYDQLSTGQRCFLGVIFKLAILLQQNKSGLIVLDDGLNNIDSVNFKRLIDILKTLPFQTVAVYQNYDLSIEDVKHFIVTREKGESSVA
jgi:DNA repair exonuclease SbcCD ATPase subunit